MVLLLAHLVIANRTDKGDGALVQTDGGQLKR